MKYYVVGRGAKEAKGRAFPSVTLVINDWDDYGVKTLFTVWYNSSESEKTKVGQIKIISADKELYDSSGYLILKSEFEFLEDNYCSLGQDTNYYRKVKELFGGDYRRFLEPLNDAVVSAGLVDDFEDDGNYKSSLIRFSEAEKALKQGLSLLNGEEFREDYNFRFCCRIGGAARDHAADFGFDKGGALPGRTISIIGGNGTGKTQYLAKLALAISGEKDQGVFTPSRPLFNKVIAVSYSAFDKFDRPAKKRSFSYQYCGIKDSGGFLNFRKLEKKYKESCDRITKKSREMFWHKVLKKIIDEEVLDRIYDDFFDNRVYADIVRNSDGSLSSGQSILMYVVTEILANIREDSLILFDEPEMHLHPHAISRLVSMLDLILERFDSYAILATHSPIIIQEMPSKNVIVFEREGSVPSVRRLGMETFGENISEITKSVFETINNEPNYKSVLRDLSKTRTYENVLALFDNRLSLNGEIYLKGCYKSEKS
ncbi:AAA family ATPase [Alcanivorax sp.]|uniref:AAA family ATPase n=1 Tax=Alcanivorax sp. TaxID=1872427 RepID=UPI002B277036|nr:AAA family ATPase [Alcanivorax sp.]